MKQPKKLTRHQREYLQRRKIDTENVVCIEETNSYIRLLKNNTEEIFVNKYIVDVNKMKASR